MVHPLLYEINTRCWLRELSDKKGGAITLGSVPDAEFANWKRLGFTHIWLMGVWQSGPLARAEALRWEQRQAYSEALPDWAEGDVVASPYAICNYEVAPALGGESGLVTFRRKLNGMGIKLLLDFVPNHLGIDHPWIDEQPELFVQAQGASSQEAGFFARQTREGVRLFAHGKDPNFPAWSDTIQLDYRRPQTHAAMLDLLHSIARRCDGVRCDMAMLILPDIFSRTWSGFPLSNGDGVAASKSFWNEAIASVKAAHGAFLFLAEAYWGMEPRLQEEGFDFTYDKELYDRLVARDAAGVQRQVTKQLTPGSALRSRADSADGRAGDPAFKHGEVNEGASIAQSSEIEDAQPILARGAHFLENHDERRIASILGAAEHRAAALVIFALPGMRLLHEGQLRGLTRRLPVQLSRRCIEPEVLEVVHTYEELLHGLQNSSIGKGQFAVPRLVEAWSGNPTHENFIVVQWQFEPDSFHVAVVNLAAHQGQCFAPLRVTNLREHTWQIRNILGSETFTRNGDELASGLFLDLPALAACIFHFSR